MTVPELLDSLRGEKIVFVPNPGNAGDSLIAASEYFIFRSLGLNFRTIFVDDEFQLASDEVVVYGGGGNLVGLYRNAADFLSVARKLAKKIIILPHTIRDNEELLRSLSSADIIFCREVESFNHVKSVNSAIDCRLADDMAFDLPVQDILARSSNLGYRFWDRFTVRSAKRMLRSILYSAVFRGRTDTVSAYRGDIEGLGLADCTLNIDISQKFAADDMSEKSSRETAYDMFRFLLRFNVVKTDRLHVCIAAALLGRRVELFDNSYGKNSSVYYHSMKNSFPNVTLMR